jgi:ELWxxDGT repeat protein
MTARSGASRSILAAVALAYLSAAATAQPAYLVADIASGPNDSFPSGFTAVGNTVYFAASDTAPGLWKSDGTPAGTMLLSHLDSSPAELTATGTALFFVGAVGPTQRLWRSGGTAATTTPVLPLLSSPTWLTAAPAGLFLAAADTQFGNEVRRTDEAASDAVLIGDIVPGQSGSMPHDLVTADGALFFIASDAQGDALWKSSGVAGDATLLRRFCGGTSDAPVLCPTRLTAVNGVLFFFAFCPNGGSGLWRSDGTAPGTELLRCINPDPFADAQISEPTAVGDLLYFAANDGIVGTELWRSDGTAQGTQIVKDINPGGDAFPFWLTNADGTLYFRADDGVHGMELWKSDGTTAGTVMVQDINPGSDGSSPDWLTSIGGGEIVFSASDASDGAEPFVSDGTAAGTRRLQDINTGANGSTPEEYTVAGANVFFRADDGQHGAELWVLPVATLQATSTPTPTSTPTSTATSSPASTPSQTSTPTLTSTASATSSPSVAPTASATPTVTPTAAVCTGDCDRSGTVSLVELVRCLRVVNGNLPLSDCVPCDRDGDGADLRDLVRALRNANDGGCR